MNASWHTYEWVMAHIWMSHGTHVNESCHTCEWVMAHIWMSHGTHVNASRHTCAEVMVHIRMSHGTHMNESWYTYKWVMAHILVEVETRNLWVMAHIWMSHGSHVNASWHTCECVTAHMCRSHGAYTNESWHTCEWVMVHISPMCYIRARASDSKESGHSPIYSLASPVVFAQTHTDRQTPDRPRVGEQQEKEEKAALTKLDEIYGDLSFSRSFSRSRDFSFKWMNTSNGRIKSHGRINYRVA